MLEQTRNKRIRLSNQGQTLNVAADKPVMRLKLTGTDQMLSKLYRCATHFARETGKDPFSSAGFTYD